MDTRGGREAELTDEIAAAFRTGDPEHLAGLWKQLDSELGHERASELWQHALAGLDASAAT